MTTQTDAEKKKKQQQAASTTTAGNVVGETLDTVTDVLLIDSIVDLAGDIISGIMD